MAERVELGGDPPAGVAGVEGGAVAQVLGGGAKLEGVLEIPEDYSVAKQVLINMLVFDYLPRYLPYAAALLAVLVGLAVYSRRKKRAAGGATQ